MQNPQNWAHSAVLAKSDHLQVSINGTLSATIQKQRMLFQANILLILWNRHLFYAFTTFGWVINQFRKVHSFSFEPKPPKQQKLNIGSIYLALSSVHFQMCPEMACLRGCILALVAFVWLFTIVCFQMVPQNVCTWRFLITPIAFVWPFSAVDFQMSPQIACLSGSKITLAAFVQLFPNVRFQMCPQIACLWRSIVTLAAFV